MSTAVSEGDRIAQLLLEKIITPDVVEVSDLEEARVGKPLKLRITV